VDAALDNNTFIVLIYLLTGRLLHEVAHGVMVYIAMRPEVRPVRFNPLAYTSWAYTWAWPIVGWAVLTMPLPGAMVNVKAEDLRGRGWQSLVAVAGPIVTFGLLGLVAMRWGDSGPVPRGVTQWFRIEWVAAWLNLLPLPGLDGYGMIEPWLLRKWRNYCENKRLFGPILLLVLLPLPKLLSVMKVQPEHVYVMPGFLLVMGLGIASLVLMERWREKQSSKLSQVDDTIKAVTLRNLEQIQGQIAANPRQVAAGLWIELSKSLEDLGRLDEAIAVYEQAVVHRPKDVTLWRSRGQLLTKQGLYEEGLASYIQASNLVGGDNSDTWHLQADVLLELERWEMAIALFDKMLDQKPNDSHVLADRGYALFHLDKFEAAGRSLKMAVALEPNTYNCYWYAQALRSVGEQKQAIAALRIALNKRADHASVNLLIDLQRQIRDYEGAIASCDQFLPKYLSAAAIACRKAALWLQLDQPEQALKLLSEVSREALPLMDLRLRCQLYYQAGDYEAALADCLLSLK
jgi:tetratricopeptide (TPR) repeat protein/Zn-dependent protease